MLRNLKNVRGTLVTCLACYSPGIFPSTFSPVRIYVLS